LKQRPGFERKFAASKVLNDKNLMALSTIQSLIAKALIDFESSNREPINFSSARNLA